MLQASSLRSRLAIGVSAAAMLGVAGPVWAQQQAPEGGATVIEELVVTAQRREQSIQDVPLAVSAFSQESLEVQKLETGQDLLLAVPNVTFSRGNFGGFNFQIRGIGTKLVATSADAAIGVHVNSVPLGASTLADSEFFDIERVEILRGPQGTQFGRNSTGGVVNIITNKATQDFSGSITGDVGNFETRRAKGYINLPLSDTFALRVAGSYVNRGGFGNNVVTGNDIDGRDLYSTRVTLGWEPSERFDAQLLWEHFEEDDNRTRVGKQLCVQDLGRTEISGVPTNVSPLTDTSVYFSQGCKQAELSGSNALGAVNTLVTAGGGPLNLFGVQSGNANAGKTQVPDLRSIEAVFDPIYRNEADFVELLLNYDLTDALVLSYSGGYSKTKSFTSADYNRLRPATGFNPNTPITDENGVIEDPQVGNRDRFTSIDFSDGEGDFRSHEVRLQSSYDGPFNFSLGASYSKLKALTNYYVTSNSLTGTAQFINLTTVDPETGAPLCPKNGTTPNDPVCLYIDPNPFPDGSGQNYFNSRTRYQLTSQAYFGELYYDLAEDLRLTVGLRYTQDRKRAQPFPLKLLNSNPTPLPAQRANFNEVTGRANLEWSPDLGFTDDSLFYASYARGYKGGGFNPPESEGLDTFPDLYDPEFIDAFEIGTKNTLLGGQLVLNGTAFFYNYSGYQVSSIIQRTSVNVNIDAEIAGAELEAIWEPVENLRFNANIGYLHTKIADGVESLDLMNLTQGNAEYQTIKAGYNLQYNNCIAPVDQLAELQARINAAGGAIPPLFVVGTQSGVLPDGLARGVCYGAFMPGMPGALITGVTVEPYGLELVDGVYQLTQPGIPADISGNELPNSPEWTVSLGAQYTFESSAGWSVTPRVDFYYQADAYARIFNAVNDKLDSYTNVNATLNFDFPDYGVQAQIYVKNATDEEVITDKYLTDDASGLFTNIFLTEPRTYGLAVTKSF